MQPLPDKPSHRGVGVGVGVCLKCSSSSTLSFLLHTYIQQRKKMLSVFSGLWIGSLAPVNVYIG